MSSSSSWEDDEWLIFTFVAITILHSFIAPRQNFWQQQLAGVHRQRLWNKPRWPRPRSQGMATEQRSGLERARRRQIPSTRTYRRMTGCVIINPCESTQQACIKHTIPVVFVVRHAFEGPSVGNAVGVLDFQGRILVIVILVYCQMGLTAHSLSGYNNLVPVQWHLQLLAAISNAANIGRVVPCNFRLM